MNLKIAKRRKGKSSQAKLAQGFTAFPTSCRVIILHFFAADNFRALLPRMTISTATAEVVCADMRGVGLELLNRCSFVYVDLQHPKVKIQSENEQIIDPQT